MSVFRVRNENKDPEQDNAEEDHDHHDAEPPEGNAVFSEFALSPVEFVQRPAGDEVVDLLIRYCSGGGRHVATLPSVGVRKPKLNITTKFAQECVGKPASIALAQFLLA